MVTACWQAGKKLGTWKSQEINVFLYLSAPQLAALRVHGADYGLHCSTQEAVPGAQHQVRFVRGPRHKVREAVSLLGALPLLLRAHVRGAQNIRLAWALPGSLYLAPEDNHVAKCHALLAHTTVVTTFCRSRLG